MKNSPLFICLLFVVLLWSCSSDDDNNDIVIGKWVPIEAYESNIQVELTTCQPYFYTEFKADNTMNSDYIENVEIPDECLVVFDSGVLHWENIGNQQYRIWDDSGWETSYSLYKEQGNLVEEYSNGNTKIVYATYE